VGTRLSTTRHLPQVLESRIMTPPKNGQADGLHTEGPRRPAEMEDTMTTETDPDQIFADRLMVSNRPAKPAPPAKKETHDVAEDVDTRFAERLLRAANRKADQ
jgi:hypothetical protein